MAIAYHYIDNAIARYISALEIDVIGKKVKRVKHLQKQCLCDEFKDCGANAEPLRDIVKSRCLKIPDFFVNLYILFDSTEKSGIWGFPFYFYLSTFYLATASLIRFLRELVY